MTAELERRIRMLERRLGQLEHRKQHVWRNTPALDLDSGSPVDAQYVVMALNSTLSAERRLQVTAPLTLTDGGANGDATIALGTSGLSTIVPNGLARGHGWWLPTGVGVTGIEAHGIRANLISGAQAYPALSNASLLQSIRRWQWTAIVGAGSSNGNIVSWSSASQDHRHFWRGDASSLGGFFIAFLGMTLVMDANTRCMIGLLGGTSNGPAATIDPSTLTQMFALAADDTDANLQIMSNDGSGSATKTDLGIAKDGISTRIYDLFLYAAPNASSIQYRLIRRDAAGDTGAQSISSDLPTNTEFMGILTHMHYPGGSVAATSLAMRAVYAEWNVGQGVESYGFF